VSAVRSVLAVGARATGRIRAPTTTITAAVGLLRRSATFSSLSLVEEQQNEHPMNARTATDKDATYVMSLMRANRESVGGLPRPAIDERIERGTLLLGTVNDDPAGYLLYDYRGGSLRIPQACIQYDARRRAYGADLVRELLARYPLAHEIRLRCAADLEANLFWRDLGFTCTATTPGGRRRGRTLNHWTLWLEPRLFKPDVISVAPAAELRVDTMYDDTDFLKSVPDGFTARTLPKLAWANRPLDKVRATT